MEDMTVSVATSAPNMNTAQPRQPATTSKRWHPRRRGACNMCKLKKIRCDGAPQCENCRRHNQECEYTLAKKRQSTKTSVGSQDSEKSQADRSQPEDTGNSGNDILLGALDSGLVSPGLANPPSGTTKTLANGSYVVPQMGSSLSDDQSAAGALPEDVAWSVETDADGMHSLSPPTDPMALSDLADPSAFLWPVLTGDLDWQFNSEIPFTAGPGSSPIETRSTSRTDFDISQPSDRPTPSSSDSTGYSRELVEYLSLNEKRPTKNFLDPVPSINYSLKAVFFARDRGLSYLSTNEQDEVHRIFHRMSLVQTRLSLADLSEKECYDGHANWYKNDVALMESCRTACFLRPVGISNFLPAPYFDRLMKETAARSPGSSMPKTLVDSVMAFGYQSYLTMTQRFVGSEERKKAIVYSIIALRSRSNVLNSANSLLKLQTLLAMITLSEQLDETIHLELLTGAVSCARALKLQYRDQGRGEIQGSKDGDLARKSLWYLYCMEVPHSLRQGISPALDHDWIDYAPPQAGKETDWFSLQCLYAITISSATKMLFNQQSLRQSVAEREQKLRQAYDLLECWRSNLPGPLQNVHKQDMHEILYDHQTRHIALSIFRQYHEAIFVIYYPWASSQSGGRVSEGSRRKSMELCVNSAQLVLATANQIIGMDIPDSKFIDLIPVSICITFLDVATSSGRPSKSIEYLSMGCGIFGRLNLLENEVPLADVLELTRTAQQIKAS